MGTEVKNAPAPGTPEWRRIVTASKVPEMIRDKETGEYLGIGYNSAYEQWAAMLGKFELPISESTREMFNDAHDAEDYAVNKWKRLNPDWQTNKGEVAYTDESLPFKNIATLDRRARIGSRRRILEVKRPRFSAGVRDGWLVQVTFQMGVSGIHEADLIEIPKYSDMVVHHIEFDQELFDAIVEDARRFVNLLELELPPAAGDSEHAKEIFAKLNPVNPEADDVEVPEDVMDQLLAAWKKLSAAEVEARTVENRVAELMGDAPVAKFGKVRVASRTAGRFAQSRVPEDKRDLLTEVSLMSLKLDNKKLKKKYPELYAEACGDGSFKFERKKWEEK